MKVLFKKIKKHHNIARRHLHRDLKIRLAYFAVIFFVMISLISYNVFENEIGIFLASVGFLIGIGIGIATGRISSVHWHPENKKVVSRMDKMGVSFLLPYLLFTLFRERILEHWFRGVLLTAFTSSLIAGIMLGRIGFLIFRIEKTLKEEGITVS